jgi:large subunit ribosomal protein L23
MIKLIPITTEKSVALQSKGVYTFWVDTKASKSQSASSFFASFAAKPLLIRTLIARGKVKTNWKDRSKIIRSDRKKAIVTIDAKNKIESLQLKTK